MNNKPITETVGNKAIVLDHDTFLKMLDRPTLRDQFAMAALTGLMSAHNSDGEWTHGYSSETARYSYQLADAMLKARGYSDE